jgi:TonB family protein
MMPAALLLLIGSFVQEAPRAKIVLRISQDALPQNLPLDLALIRRSVEESAALMGITIEEAPEGAGPAVPLTLRLQATSRTSGAVIFSVNASIPDAAPKKEVLRSGALTGVRIPELALGEISDACGITAMQLLSRRFGIAAPTTFPRPMQGPAAQGKAPTRIPAPSVYVEFKQMKVKHKPSPPPYPAFAKANRIQGVVVVEMTIDPEGNPARGSVVSGDPALAVAALDNALTWSFQPALIEGQPQWTRFKLNIPFRLMDNPYPPSEPIAPRYHK